MTIIHMDGKEFTVRGRLLRVLALRDEIIDHVEDPDRIVHRCREMKIPADLFAFSQQIPDTSPRFDYHIDWDAMAAVPISTYEHWIMKQVHPNTRNKIRKAEKKGVVVKVETISRRLAEGMVGIFNETPVRRGKRYSYYGRTVDTVVEEWSRDSNRSDFLVAYHRDETIGFIQLVYAQRFARTSGTVAKISHRDKSPMNALMAKAVEVCAEKGIPYLVYGRYEYGKKGEDSLSSFKKNNGFQRIDLPRYSIPLSIRGSLALRLCMHNGISGAIPAPLLGMLLHIRSSWYGKLAS